MVVGWLVVSWVMGFGLPAWFRRGRMDDCFGYIRIYWMEFTSTEIVLLFSKEILIVLKQISGELYECCCCFTDGSDSGDENLHFEFLPYLKRPACTRNGLHVSDFYAEQNALPASRSDPQPPYFLIKFFIIDTAPAR